MAKQHNRRVYAGYYKCYDGKLIYVITLAKDADTDEPIVIFHYVDNAHNVKEVEYCIMRKSSFCEMVAINGEYVDKFVRQTKMKVSEWKALNLMEDGFRGPKRKRPPELHDEYAERYYRTADNYIDYAKDICNNYSIDVRKYQLCLKHKKCIGIAKADLAILVEDIIYLKSCLNTVLSEYKGFFKERYIQGKSIRKYANDNNLNRGSVEYLQRKFINEFALLLKKRDASDSICRLNREKDYEALLFDGEML